jgi:hypothetical protein
MNQVLKASELNTILLALDTHMYGLYVAEKFEISSALRTQGISILSIHMLPNFSVNFITLLSQQQLHTYKSNVNITNVHILGNESRLYYNTYIGVMVFVK